VSERPDGPHRVLGSGDGDPRNSRERAAPGVASVCLRGSPALLALPRGRTLQRRTAARPDRRRRARRCMCGAPQCRGTMDTQPERFRDFGKRVDVFWDGDGVFYRGTVTSYSAASRKHTILYDDNDVERVLLAARARGARPRPPPPAPDAALGVRRRRGARAGLPTARPRVVGKGMCLEYACARDLAGQLSTRRYEHQSQGFAAPSSLCMLRNPSCDLKVYPLITSHLRGRRAGRAAPLGG